jgi:hypothetical protein
MNPAVFKLVDDLAALCFIDDDEGRGDDVRTFATLNRFEALKVVRDALAQARLEGAKAMQHAAYYASHTAWLNSTNGGQDTSVYINALDPQQVINESVK